MEGLIGACRALGEPTRMRAMRIILEARTGLTASDLVRILGKPQYTISKALGILVDAGLVEETRAGRMVFYRAAKGPSSGPLFEAVSASSPPQDFRACRRRLLTCLLGREDGVAEVVPPARAKASRGSRRGRAS